MERRIAIIGLVITTMTLIFGDDLYKKVCGHDFFDHERSIADCRRDRPQSSVTPVATAAPVGGPPSTGVAPTNVPADTPKPAATPTQAVPTAVPTSVSATSTSPPSPNPPGPVAAAPKSSTATPSPAGSSRTPTPASKRQPTPTPAPLDNEEEDTSVEGLWNRAQFSFGPTFGNLGDGRTGYIVHYSNIHMRNLVVEAVFSNPHDTGQGGFDHGLIIRATNTMETRILIRHDGACIVETVDKSSDPPKGISIEQYTANRFNSNYQGQNSLRVYAYDDIGYAIVNGFVVAEFDLSDNLNRGNTGVIAQARRYLVRTVAPIVTPYSEFRIWTIRDP